MGEEEGILMRYGRKISEMQRQVRAGYKINFVNGLRGLFSAANWDQNILIYYFFTRLCLFPFEFRIEKDGRMNKKVVENKYITSRW